MNLFDDAVLAGGPVRKDLAAGVWVIHIPGWLPVDQAERLEAWLQTVALWEHARLGGWPNGTPLPRLTAWCGDAAYRYSGITNAPAPWLAGLTAIRDRADAAIAREVPGWPGFNGCLLNRYRTGTDSVGWHRDDEPDLGDLDRIVVASVSLGATRRFQVRALGGRGFTWPLAAGDLFVMGPGVQVGWEHGAPKDPAVRDERISLNLRRIVSMRHQS